MTNAEGSISLAHIPPGNVRLWPYRSEAEGQMLYDAAAGDGRARSRSTLLTGGTRDSAAQGAGASSNHRHGGSA